MDSRDTFSAGGSQRAKGPQPVKKGRTPGPAGDGKGAVEWVSEEMHVGVRASFRLGSIYV
jgi:hypothetical protein